MGRRIALKAIGLIGGMSWESTVTYYQVSLLVRPEDTNVPLFDTTLIHARRAALRALEG